MLLLFGLFTLVACSEDVVPETADVKQDEGIAPPTFDPDIPYESPFNTFGDNIIIPYIIVNDLPEDIEIVGYFGFGYYDGADDGDWFGYYDLTQPEFSTIYQNSNEYLNMVRSTVTNFGPLTTTILEDERCPSVGTSPSPLNPTGVAFTLDGMLFGPPANGSGDEAELIHQNGKIYFLDVNIPSIGYSTTIKVKFGDDSMDFANLSSFNPDWDLVGGNITGIPGDLVYHVDTGEICLANDSSGNGLRSEDSFVDGSGQTWYVRAYTDGNGVYITVTL